MAKPSLGPVEAKGSTSPSRHPALRLRRSRSAAFYSNVFGWPVRQRDDGSTAFDDGPGEVSGTWVLGRPPESNLSLVVSVMVDDMEVTLRAVVAAGGEVIQGVGAHAPEITALIADPYGNRLGLYQEPQ